MINPTKRELFSVFHFSQLKELDDEGKQDTKKKDLPTKQHMQLSQVLQASCLFSI